MRIVVDTNIICQDYNLNGNGFRLLLDSLETIPAKLYVPEIVVDEAVNLYREDLEQLLQSLEGSAAKINALTGRQSMHFEKPNPKNEANSYRRQLMSRIDSVNGVMIPYPEISHKQVVERDLARKKPFKRNGSGYRDLLIWECIKSLLVLGSEEVVFISANTKDFGLGPLVDIDLQIEILNPSRLQVFRNLKDFNEAYVFPNLRMLDDFKARLQAEAVDSFDIRKWLKENLLKMLYDYDFATEVAGIPTEVGRVRATEIITLEDISVQAVRELESKDKLVEAIVSVKMNFSIDVNWADYLQNDEVRERIRKGHKPVNNFPANVAEKITAKIEFIIDAKTNAVTSQELARMEGPYGLTAFPGYVG